MRILHVFRAPLGGLYRHVLDLAHAQVERGHDVGIFCDSTTGGARADETLAALAPRLTLGLVRLPIKRPPSLSDIGVIKRLRDFCRRVEPDVLHGHGSKGGVYARTIDALGIPGRPVRAYTPHGGSFNYFPGTSAHRLYMMVERALARRTDVFLCESAFIAGRITDAVGKPRAPLRIVHNGIGPSECIPITRATDAVELLYIGELRFAKGIDTLLMALGLLKSGHGLTPRLLLVGSGPEEEALKMRAVELGVSDQVTFAGPAPIRDVLSRARIMVVPSRAESLPYVILEAAAAAQPLISTNVGGIPELFGPFGDRMLPPDDPEAFARAIALALSRPDSDLQAEAAELAAFVATNFSLDDMVTGVLDGYEAGRKGLTAGSLRSG